MRADGQRPTSAATPQAHIYNDIYAGWEPRTPTPTRGWTPCPPSPYLSLSPAPVPQGDGGWEKMLTAPLITLASGLCKPTLESCAAHTCVGYFLPLAMLRHQIKGHSPNASGRDATLVSTPQTIVDNHGTEQAQFPERKYTNVLFFDEEKQQQSVIAVKEKLFKEFKLSFRWSLLCRLPSAKSCRNLQANSCLTSTHSSMAPAGPIAPSGTPIRTSTRGSFSCSRR